jgi:hypothetical protein
MYVYIDAGMLCDVYNVYFILLKINAFYAVSPVRTFINHGMVKV